MEKLKKEAVWRKIIIDICAVSFFMFILPYLCNLFFNGIYHRAEDVTVPEGREVVVVTPAGEEILPLEEYLIGALAGSVPITYEDATLRAMSVILRTNLLCSKFPKSDDKNETTYFDPVEQKKLWGADYQKNYNRLASIVADTNRTVLVYEGEIIYAPFFDVCAGYTRPGTALGDDFVYLQSVKSPADVLSERYLQEFEFNVDEVGENVYPEDVSSHGYVLRIVADGVSYSGDEFRKKYALPSTNFSIQRQKNKYRITVKGVGHGFGFSRYGANEMAKTGMDFTELLAYYYHDVTLEKK